MYGAHRKPGRTLQGVDMTHTVQRSQPANKHRRQLLPEPHAPALHLFLQAFSTRACRQQNITLSEQEPLLS
jgi:hypothetical protein